jgi:hypothetical protein
MVELAVSKVNVVDNFRVNITDSVPLSVREVVEDRSAINPAKGADVHCNRFPLEKMQFRLTTGVNSPKLAAFVNKIETYWYCLGHALTSVDQIAISFSVSA